MTDRALTENLRLINDILDFERLSTGMIELQFGQVSAESIVCRAVESLATFGTRTCDHRRAG